MTDKKLKCLGNKLDMALIKASDELIDPTEQLAKRAANGDRAAFSQLIDLQYDFIFSVAFKWLGHRDDAQDVAQDVAIKLARNISGFDGRAKFTTWLYRVILNTVRDFQKAAARRGSKTEALKLVSPTQEPSSQEQDVTLSEVWAAVRALPEKQRDAVLMVYAQDMSHAECADILKCKQSTVSWYVHEAKKSLKGLL